MAAIAILVPVYNAEKFIGAMIRSVRKQSFRDWEMTVLDDGSSDGTAAVCKRYCRLDPRIRYLHQENQGTVKTRRTLLGQVGNAGYFMYLDADDCLNPCALERFMAVAEKAENPDIVMTQGIRNVSHRWCVGRKGAAAIKREPLQFTVERGKNLVADFLGYSRYNVGLVSKLFSSKLAQTDMESMPHLFIGEDTCANVLLFAAADRVAVIPDLLYYYRAGGCSSQFRPNLAQEIAELYSWRKGYILKNGLESELHRRNLIHALTMLYNLSEGYTVNPIKIRNAVKLLLEDAEKLDLGRYRRFADFWEKATEEELVVPKSRPSLSVRIKQILLKHL